MIRGVAALEYIGKLTLENDAKLSLSLTHQCHHWCAWKRNLTSTTMGLIGVPIPLMGVPISGNFATLKI